MPGNGYPMGLVLPGYQGNMNVKFLRRLKLTEGPAMSYYEGKIYSQLLPDGKAYRFHFLQEVKSFITHPSFGLKMNGPGYYEISGIAYSGNGRISRVMVSADGGKRGRRRRSRSRCTPRLLPASARPGAGMAVPRSCKVAPGTKPATRNRLAPSSWPCGARPRSRLRIFSRSPTSTTTASRAGGSAAMGRSNMSTLKLVLALVLALVLSSGSALAQTPRLGKPISEADIKAWDIAVMPDGTGLPPGSGTAVQGARVFAEKCSACHGEGGKGSPLAPAPLV